jgi:hypothetical protein
MARAILALLGVIACCAPSLAQVGDGVADDTLAIQAAIDAVDNAGGGTVRLPRGSYKITATLIINRSSTFKTINLMGEGMLATRILWLGPTSGAAIRVNGLKRYIFEGWSLENRVAKGTTTGVLVQRDSGTGTQSGSTSWRNISVSSFATGIQIGNSAITQAGSEFLFDNLLLLRNDIGCLIQDGNSLNFAFTMLEMGGNGTGLQVLSGGNVSVYGGSASYDTVADFDLRPGGVFTIIGFRSEHANRFLIGGNTSAGTGITLMGCLVEAISNPDGFGIVVGSGPIVMLSNVFVCKVRVVSNAWCSDVAIGNSVADSVPFVVSGTGGHYVQLGNRQVNTKNEAVGHFPDEMGYVSTATRIPSWKVPGAGQLQLGSGTAITTHLSGMATWDPPRLDPAAQITTTVSVSGASVGDTVSVGFSQDLRAMQLTAYVSSSGTVTVLLRNGTDAAIDLASGILRADTWPH